MHHFFLTSYADILYWESCWNGLISSDRCHNGGSQLGVKSLGEAHVPAAVRGHARLGLKRSRCAYLQAHAGKEGVRA